MAAKEIFSGCSLLSSSSLLPPSPISSMLGAKHSTKFPSPNFQLHCLPLAAHGAAPIKAMQSSTSTIQTAEPKSSSEKTDAKALPVAERWREIQGENHWEGLLDHPIDATLRAEIIRYGEFAQVTYDSFDFNEHSLYCGSCKYSRRKLFEEVDKANCGYEVTKYLYATSELDLPKFFKTSSREEEDERWCRDSNWIGYIAVCTDEAEIKRIGRRDIVVAWRGTVTSTEWADDAMTTQVVAKLEAGAHDDVHVERGFLSLYTSSKASSRFNKLSCGQQMAVEVKRLLEKYKGEEMSISIVGHSLGAALAILCGYDIAANIVAAAPVTASAGSSPLITVFSFAGPRVGNKAFKTRVEGLGVRVLRMVNEHDIVPKVPGLVFNEKFPQIWSIASTYYHVGKELRIDFDVSPHLRRTRDLPDHHNLEAHLHVLDGFHGPKQPFKSVFGRNPTLVNKSSDFLAKGAYIPASWWQDRNKGLIKDPSTGQWVLATRKDEHYPENHHP